MDVHGFIQDFWVGGGDSTPRGDLGACSPGILFEN